MMAQRRMFSLEVVDTDAFLDLPASSQALYFHLGMRADDDGFVSSPKKITAMVNCSADDLKLLIAKGFIIPFESGVCVIRDWKAQNKIQPSRIVHTKYKEELSKLSEDENEAYLLLSTNCQQISDNLSTQYRIGKDSIVQESKKRGADKLPRASRFTPPTVEEVAKYCTERGNRIDPEQFVDFYSAKGWRVGNQSMRDWRAAVRTWEKRDRSDGKAAPVDIRDPRNYAFAEEDSL